MLEDSLSGLDFFHCDYFQQYDATCGDVMWFKGTNQVSALNSVERQLRKYRIYDLNDNLFKIKRIPIDYDFTRKIGKVKKGKS